MKQSIYQLFYNILDDVSRGSSQEDLIKARKDYSSRVGVLNEEHDEYEAYMCLLNDWFLTRYKLASNQRTPIEDYVENKHLSDEIKQALFGVNYSLFEYIKKSFKGLYVVKDLISANKFTLANDHAELGLLKGDVFIGRSLHYNDMNYLLEGKCNIPYDVRSKVLKQAKKVKKQKEEQLMEDFLLKVESLKIKWIHYGHVQSEKIFLF